jgi:hypothetical protein
MEENAQIIVVRRASLPSPVTPDFEEEEAEVPVEEIINLLPRLALFQVTADSNCDFCTVSGHRYT